jgi:ABC-type antimicrobial peptide transport system permease subunit/class 3 adenylate cyclase
MLLLAYRNLRARQARTLFTALAIALGVGMIFAMRIVGVTFEESARAAREGRLSGADLEVSGANGGKFNDTAAGVVQMRPEVELAAPILRGQEGVMIHDPSVVIGGVSMKGTGLALLGIDPTRRLSTYDLAAGSFFSAPDAMEVLLPTSWAALHGLGVDSEIELTTGPNVQTHTYKVVGLLKAETAGQPTAWLPLRTMQAVFDSPGVATAVLVRLKPDVNTDSARDALQTALGAQFAVVNTAGGAGLNSFFSLTRLALPFSGFIVLLAGAFLVFNAFAITLAERRKETGQLRALGMTRGQVMAQMLTEALLTALFGSVLGLGFGWALGRGVTLSIRTLQGEGNIPNVPLPLDGLGLALGAGVLVTLGVTLSLAVQAARVSPLEALRGAAQEGKAKPRSDLWLGGVGAALLAATGLLAWRAAQVSREALTPSYTPIFLTVGTLMLAGLCFIPLWMTAVIALGERMPRTGHLAAVIQLAAGSLGRQRHRAALTAITLTLGLMIIITLSGITFIFRDYLLSANQSLLRADFGLARPFPPGTSFEDFTRLPSPPPIPKNLQADIDALSDVAEVTYFTNVSLPGLGVETGMGDQYSFGLNFEKVRGNSVFPLAEGSWDEAETYFASGPAILLPELTARRLNKHVGDTLDVDTLIGKQPFTVAAVGGGYPVVMPSIAQQYFGAQPFAILIDAKSGVDPATLEKRVRAIQDKYGAEVAPLNLGAFQQAVDNLTGPMVALFGGLTSLSGIVAALSMVVTLIASVLERQREIGTLRAMGMSRAQVRGLIVAEAGLLGLAGASLGAVAGLAMAYTFGTLLLKGVEAISGLRVVTEAPIPWAVAGAALLTGPAMAMLAALWPADRAANVNPAEAMRAEGATGFLKPAAHLGPTGLRGLIARLPLAAYLSLVLGLMFITSLAALTAVRVRYERQLLEDNTLRTLARQMDFLAATNHDRFGPEVTELTPQMMALIIQQADIQAEALNLQLQDVDTKFGVHYFLVANHHNQVIFSNRAEYTGRTLTDTVSFSGSASIARLSDWSGERLFEALVPIENNAGQLLGHARIGISVDPIDDLISDIVAGSVAAMIVALIVTIVFTFVFTRRALAPVAQIVQASRAVARGDLTQRVPETRWDEIGSLARSFNEMVTGLRDRERLRDLFGRYLSRDVSEAVLAGRVTFRGERKTITALYVDMRGSTAFAEAHAPEEVMEALNQYFEVVILAVEAHGGIVNRFVGDEVVCLFGAPSEYKDHADRALQAALAIRAGLAYLNQKRSALSLPTLKFGMGLNTGIVTAGATGSEERQEYTVIGDAMNVGARIQALNRQFPDHDILLSEFTWAALRAPAEAYTFADLGPVELRGKSQPVSVYGLVGRRG